MNKKFRPVEYLNSGAMGSTYSHLLVTESITSAFSAGLLFKITSSETGSDVVLDNEQVANLVTRLNAFLESNPVKVTTPKWEDL